MRIISQRVSKPCCTLETYTILLVTCSSGKLEKIHEETRSAGWGSRHEGAEVSATEGTRGGSMRLAQLLEEPL